METFGQKGQFWTVFSQNGQNGENYQKSAWNIFSHLQALTKCKVSEKSNERFLRLLIAAYKCLRNGYIVIMF